MALAGVVSTKEKFNNQASVLDDILFPKEWNRSGLTVIVDLPETAAFVYQALHGAAALITNQLTLGIRLARARLDDSRDKRVPLYRKSEIIGWPKTLGGNSRVAWEFLWDLPDQWQWLREIFGEPDDFRIALCAYHMALSILELAETIASGNEKILEQDQLHLDVPVRFPALGREITRKAYRLLCHDPEQVKAIWKKLGVRDDQIKKHWQRWIEHTASWVRRDYPFADISFPNKDLPSDLGL